MNRKHKKLLARILLGGALFAVGWLFPAGSYIRTGVFALSFLIAGYDVLLRAGKNILRGQVFDENFLMTLAGIGAFFVGEAPEGAAVMLFYQVGELFQSCAVASSRKSITELMNLRPDSAHVLRDGALCRVDPETVAVGEVVVVSAGEKIPLDGVIVQGETTVDTASLTGESVPRSCAVGDTVLSGCVNLSGTVQVQVTCAYDSCTAAKILELVENAAAKKTKYESFITKFARYYTPAVVLSAVLLAAIPPLIQGGNFAEWIHRALTFLVVSCPCALVISVPLTFFGGIGGASKNGVLIKGSNYFEGLSKVNTVVMDKTGTLTEGKFSVVRTAPVGISEQELLHLAASAEKYSTHPLAGAVRAACAGEISKSVCEVTELAGQGISAQVDGARIHVGNARLMASIGICAAEQDAAGTVIHVAREKTYLGAIYVADQLKASARETVERLKEMGVRTVMLTGDRAAAAEAVAKTLCVDAYYAELLPADKVARTEQLLESKGKGSVLFVGDGINDAPVLSRADIGVAMGGIGSDAATEAADVVIMQDEPEKLITAIQIARRTMRIARQNIVFALAVKGLVLLLGAIGVGSMWEAVFADVGVAVIAILNAMRAAGYKEKRTNRAQ